MNFSEAMQRLQEGCKVCRSNAAAPLFFKLVNNQVKCFQDSVVFYNYDESIFLSKGWEIIGLEFEGCKVEYAFYELMPHLQKGAKAKLKDSADWVDSYIYVDKESKTIVLKTILEHQFIPDLESLMAQDWIVIG